MTNERILTLARQVADLHVEVRLERQAREEGRLACEQYSPRIEQEVDIGTPHCFADYTADMEPLPETEWCQACLQSKAHHLEYQRAKRALRRALDRLEKAVRR